MTKREQELFGSKSSLEQFIKEYEKQFETLTAVEVEILRLLARESAPSMICKNLELSPNDLLEKEFSIRKKLSIGLEAEYIKYALAFGLISF